MAEHFDVIVLGSGFKESLLASLLALQGKKILVLDRNSYYGSEGATADLSGVYRLLKPGVQPLCLGRNRDWNIDLIPKLLLAESSLAKLIKYSAGRYLEFQCVASAFWSDRPNISNLSAFIASHQTQSDLPFTSMVDRFHLSPEEVEFLGRAVALYEGEDSLSLPCREVLPRIQRCVDSSFVYPLYGSSGYVESCSRLCAVYGGTFMLNRSIESLLYTPNGRVRGVQSQGETFLCDFVISDASYVPSKARCTGRVVRALCLLSHPVRGVETAAYFVLSHPSRKHDIYVIVLSSVFKVCPEGFFIAYCSTEVETSAPVTELQPAMELLGDRVEEFVHVYDVYESATEGSGVFVVRSLDARGHFDGEWEEIQDVCEAIAREPLT